MGKEIKAMINSFQTDKDKVKKQYDVIKTLIEKYYFKNQFSQISIDNHVNDFSEIIMQNSLCNSGFLKINK